MSDQLTVPDGIQREKVTICLEEFQSVFSQGYATPWEKPCSDVGVTSMIRNQ